MQRRNKDALIVLGILIIGAICVFTAKSGALAKAIEKQHPNYEEVEEVETEVKEEKVEEKE